MQTTELASPANTVVLSRVGSMVTLPDGPQAASEAAKRMATGQRGTRTISAVAALILLVATVHNIMKRGKK